MSGHRDDGSYAEDKAHHPNRKVGRNKYSLTQLPAGWAVDMVSDRGMSGHPHYSGQSWNTEDEANNWALQNYGTERLPNNHPRTQ